MNAVTHLEKVIAGETSAVTYTEKVITGEAPPRTYLQKVIAGEEPPRTHLQKVIAGVESPVTHLEYIWAGGSPTPTEHEYTGVVPYTFTADGTPLLDWYIKGNTVQNGTPTPDSPVMPQGCGEKTGNLLSEKYESRSINGIGAFTIDSNYDLWLGEVVEGQTYAISNMDYVYGFFTSKPLPNTGATYDGSRGHEISGTAVVTVPSGCTWIAVRVLHNADNAMLNTGSTPLPYEPYGYKIPISSASTTTPVYLGEVESTRRIYKLVLTGQETGWNFNEPNNVFYLLAPNTMLIADSITSICTHYKAVGNKSLYINMSNNEVCIRANDTYLWIKDTTYSTVTDFKTYLQQQYAAGTPVTIWYVLATPETAVVNEPLMKIGTYADEVSNVATIPTNNGSTTIDVETTVKPSEVYIKYKGV